MTSLDHIVYCFRAQPETLPEFPCPYGSQRKVAMWKIGMSQAKHPVKRLQHEFTETLCAYLPKPKEIIIKRVANGPLAEAELTKMIRHLASKLNIASLCVTRSFSKKEIYFLTRDEIRDMFDIIDGRYSSWTRELRKSNDGAYVLSKLVRGECQAITLREGCLDHADEHVRTRIHKLLDAHSTIASCVRVENGRLKWIGPKLYITRSSPKSNTNSDKWYTISDFQWDVKKGFLCLCRRDQRSFV